MKKILIAFVIFSVSATYGQDLEFGLHAGLNYSHFWGNEAPQGISDTPAFGYLGGISVEYQTSTSKISFKAELNYERKSENADFMANVITNFDDPVETYSAKVKVHYDYIVLPLLVKYSFTQSNSFYASGGPFLAYLLNSKESYDVNAPGVLNGDSDTTYLNKRLDYGISVGIGKEFEVGPKKSFHIEIRENLGLFNTSKTDVVNGGTIKTNSLNLIVGMSFH